MPMKKCAGPAGYHPAAGSAHAAHYEPGAAKSGQASAMAAAHPCAPSLVGKVMAKQMATRTASLLANMAAPKKRAGY